MEKSPAFQFYPKDWLTDEDVNSMTLEEQGAYIRLLANEWLHKGLKNDDTFLATASGLGEKWMGKSGEKIKSCFKKRGERLVNPRLEKERKKQKSFREKCSVAGKKSASMRNNKGKGVKVGSKVGSTNLETEVQPKSNSSSSSSSSSPSSTSINKETINTIVLFLNQVLGSKYRLNNATTIKLINTRLSEGYTLDNFKSVINKKHTEWKETDMAKYLQPSTLFGNKFEGYLNQQEVKGKEQFSAKEYYDKQMEGMGKKDDRRKLSS